MAGSLTDCRRNATRIFIRQFRYWISYTSETGVFCIINNIDLFILELIDYIHLFSIYLIIWHPLFITHSNVKAKIPVLCWRCCWVTTRITPSKGTALSNVNIGLIYCQSICNKSDEISDLVKDICILMASSWQRLGWLVMFQTRKLLVTWLQLDIHSIRQPGFTRTVGGLSIPLRDSLKCETHLRLQLTFVSGGGG